MSTLINPQLFVEDHASSLFYEDFTTYGGDTLSDHGWTSYNELFFTYDEYGWLTNLYADGGGMTFIEREIPDAATYMEWRVWHDPFGGGYYDWSSGRLRTPPNTSLYDLSAHADILRNNGKQNGGFAHGSLKPGFESVDPGLPDSIATAKKVGIELVSPTEMKVYYDDILCEWWVGCDDLSANTFLSIGAFNGVQAHWEYVACYAAKP